MGNIIHDTMEVYWLDIWLNFFRDLQDFRDLRDFRGRWLGHIQEGFYHLTRGQLRAIAPLT